MFGGWPTFHRCAKRLGMSDSQQGKTPAVTDEDVPASAAVIAEWGRRVEAEYRSAAIMHHLTFWLIQMGASPDLIHDGLRIVGDEIVHAELSHATFVAAGGEVLPPIPRESLALRPRPGEELEISVARYGVELFCLGETVAVPLFKVLREKCIVETARTALDRVLKDEVRHRDFGWELLSFLLELPCADAVRATVYEEIPGMFKRIWTNYAPVGGEAVDVIPDADRAWGLMPIARYREILEQTFTREYKPRFAKLDIVVDDVWAATIAGRSE